MAKRVKLEFIARLTTEDGQEIEKMVSTDIPSPDEVDINSIKIFSTRTKKMPISTMIYRTIAYAFMHTRLIVFPQRDNRKFKNEEIHQNKSNN